MNLGTNLFNARKKSGLSQEQVAEKLGVSRQTISKWELGETIPDIYQSKRLSTLYHLTLDELIEFDVDIKEIQEAIEKTDDKLTEKIDWTKAWSKKYPILASYHKEVKKETYEIALKNLLDDLQKRYGYNELDSLLVLKDILGSIWKNKKRKKEKG